MKTNLTFADLEETNTQQQTTEEKLSELLTEKEAEQYKELNLEEPIKLNKQFITPPDEIAAEIWDRVPNEFSWKGKVQTKKQLQYILQQKGFDIWKPDVASNCAGRIASEAAQLALTVDDSVMNELLQMQSQPTVIEEIKEDTPIAAVSQEEFTQHISSKETKEDNTLQMMQQQMDKMQNIITQLSERVYILEEENKLLNQIKDALNESAAKSQTLIKSTETQQTKTENKSAEEIISSYVQPKEETPPKKRGRGRPAGYKTSNETKEKQRKARLKKLSQSNPNQRKIARDINRDMQDALCLNETQNTLKHIHNAQ